MTPVASAAVICVSALMLSSASAATATTATITQGQNKEDIDQHNRLTSIFQTPLEKKEFIVTSDEDDVTNANNEIMTTIKVSDANDADNYAGLISYTFDVWVMLMEKMKFTIKVVMPERNRNSVSSLRQMIQEGKVDGIFSSTTFTNDTRNITYAPQIDSTKYKLFIKASIESSWSSLTNVFTPVLWMTIALVMLGLAATLVCVEHVGYKIKIDGYLDAPADTGQLTIAVLGHFCYQGCIQIASGSAGRVVIFSGLACGYLVYISYNALVISQVTAVKFEPPFESLQDMAQKATHKLLVRNDPAVLEDIAASRRNKSNALAKVWDKLLPTVLTKDDMFTDEVAALRRLCSENVAMLTSHQRMTSRAMNKAKCAALPLRPIYFKSPMGFVFRSNNTAYNAALQTMLIRLRQSGLLHRWRKFWDSVDGLNEDRQKRQTTLKPISLVTMLPVFGILGTGIAFSITLLVLEILYKMWTRKLEKIKRNSQFMLFRKRSRAVSDVEAKKSLGETLVPKDDQPDI